MLSFHVHVLLITNNSVFIRYNRLEYIKKMRWEFGSVLPTEVKYNLCEQEVSCGNVLPTNILIYVNKRYIMVMEVYRGLLLNIIYASELTWTLELQLLSDLHLTCPKWHSIKLQNLNRVWSVRRSLGQNIEMPCYHTLEVTCLVQSLVYLLRVVIMTC